MEKVDKKHDTEGKEETEEEENYGGEDKKDPGDL